MNHNPGPRRRRPRQVRAVAVAAIIGGMAVATAACGGTSSVTTAGSTQYNRALAYAHCMRSHGIASFPDPDGNGDFQIQDNGGTNGGSGQRQGNSGNGVDVHSPQYAAANRSCEKLLGNGSSGPQLNGTQQAQALNQLVRYAQCIRAHGVPGFPDPTLSNGGIGFGNSGSPGASGSSGSSGFDPNSPQFKAAQQACKSLLGGAKAQSSAGGSS